MTLSPVSITPALPIANARVPFAHALQSPAQPRFEGGNDGRGENIGSSIAAFALAGLAGWAAARLLKSKPKARVQELPNGALRINEGRGDFVVEKPWECDTGAIITNDQGERIIFQQVKVARPGQAPRLRRTVERLDEKLKSRGAIEI